RQPQAARGGRGRGEQRGVAVGHAPHTNPHAVLKGSCRSASKALYRSERLFQKGAKVWPSAVPCSPTPRCSRRWPIPSASTSSAISCPPARRAHPCAHGRGETRRRIAATTCA